MLKNNHNKSQLFSTVLNTCQLSVLSFFHTLIYEILIRDSYNPYLREKETKIQRFQANLPKVKLSIMAKPSILSLRTMLLTSLPSTAHK